VDRFDSVSKVPATEFPEHEHKGPLLGAGFWRSTRGAPRSLAEYLSGLAALSCGLSCSDDAVPVRRPDSRKKLFQAKPEPDHDGAELRPSSQVGSRG
jgi:hypothetical protein